MSHSSNTSASSTTTTTGPSPKQDALISFCHSHGFRHPTFQVISDRRGGRTAWSCAVTVGDQTIQARFWYDGQYVNNAREDAAEKALQVYGQIPTPQGPKPTHFEQQRRAVYPGVGTATSAFGR